MRIRVVGTVGAAMAVLLALIALTLISRVFDVNERSLAQHNDFAECSKAASDLTAASDYLTARARLFIMTGDPSELDAYLEEVNVVDRRTASVKQLKEDFGGTRAYTALSNANAESISLSKREFYAMRLTADAFGLDELPAELENVTISDEDDALSPEEKRARAEEMVMGDQYQAAKEIIVEQTGICTAELLRDLHTEERVNSERLHMLLQWLRFITFSLLAIILAFLFVLFHYVIGPLASYAESISRGEPLALEGPQELCVVSDAYNEMFRDISLKTQQLEHDASHDALTGLYNRGSYDRLLEEAWPMCALVLADVDRFKGINDRYGHAIGDAILCRVANTLIATFGRDAHVCRIGGDEFAVILVGATSDDCEKLRARMEDVRAHLGTAKTGVPRVTLSFGAAFGTDVEGGRDSLYRAADEALYEVKRRGRDGISFYDSGAA